MQHKKRIGINDFKKGKPEQFTKKILLKESW